MDTKNSIWTTGCIQNSVVHMKRDGLENTLSVIYCQFQILRKLAALGVFFALVLFFLGGCAREPLVSVELLNRAGGACESVNIDFNGKSEELKGNVPNGNSSITGGWPYPMPASVTLRWVTEDQSRYSATLAIPLPPKARARFLDYEFVILPGGRANVAVVAWSNSTDAEVKRQVAVTDDLGRDGGPNYRVAIKNTTGANVHGVDVRFGPYAINAGADLSDTGQNFSIATGLPYPVTSLVSLRWVTSDGHPLAKVVDVANVLPSDLNDKCFWFILEEQGNVEVQIVGWNDLRAGKHPDLCHGF